MRAALLAIAFIPAIAVAQELEPRAYSNAPVGTHFQLPVNLRVQQVGLWHGWLPYARGDVLFLAIAAVLSYALLAGFSAYPSLRPPRKGQVSSG